MVLAYFICPKCKRSSLKHSHTEYKTKKYYCSQSSVHGKIVEKYFCVKCKIHLQYVCPKCRAISPSYESHLKHFNEHLVIKCRFCPLTFKRDRDLRGHENRVHVEELKQSLAGAKRKKKCQSIDESDVTNIPSISKTEESQILERVAEIIAQITVPTTVSGEVFQGRYFNQEPLPGTSCSCDHSENFTTFNTDVIPSEKSCLLTTDNSFIPINFDKEAVESSNITVLPPASGNVKKSGRNSSALVAKDVTESKESHQFLHELDELTDLPPLTPSCWTDEIIESAREVTVLEILDKYTPVPGRSLKTPDLLIKLPDNRNEYVVSDSPDSNSTHETSENIIPCITDTTLNEDNKAVNNEYATSQTVESSSSHEISESFIPFHNYTAFSEDNVTTVDKYFVLHTTQSSYGHGPSESAISFHNYRAFSKGNVTTGNEYFVSHTAESNYGHGPSENVVQFNNPTEFTIDGNENVENDNVNVGISDISETNWIDEIISSNQENLQNRNLLYINDLLMNTGDLNEGDPINTIFSQDNENIQICKSPTALPTVNETDEDIENNYLMQALVDLIQLSPEELPDKIRADLEKISTDNPSSIIQESKK